MVCEYCNKKHDGSFGSGRFCSISCSRGFSTKNKRKERNKKISSSLKNKKFGASLLERGSKRYDEWTDRLRKSWKERNQKKIEDIKKSSFETWPKNLIIDEIAKEQNRGCNNCKNTHWLGELITLELEHKDGDNRNNKRENLELLCPNCHSYTDTWRGRNKKCHENMGRVSDEEMLEALKKSKSIRQALLSVGLSPKGNNYSRCKKLLNM